MSTLAKNSGMWGMLIGDAMAMPVHWYYNIMDIKNDFGAWLTGFEAPKEKHPSSIMHLSNTTGSGRSASDSKRHKEVIGSVILHDKKKYWGAGKTVHYHCGLKAGENTLNATVAFEAYKTMKSCDPDGSMDAVKVHEKVMENYIKFMTTPNTHNDTYADSFHRQFFKDWIAEEHPPKDGPAILKFSAERFQKVTPGAEDSQIPCMSALVMTLPYIIHYANKSEQECITFAIDGLKMTHASPSMVHYAELYTRLLHAVLNGADLKTKVLEIAESPVLGNKRKVIEKYSAEASKYPKGSEKRLKVYQEAVATIGMACYINGSMPSMLLLAHEFADDFKGGILMNTNCGGENVNRGASLGALLAAAAVNKKTEVDPELKKGLVMFEKFNNLLK